MTYTWRGIATPSIERLQLVGAADIDVRSTVEDGDERYEYEAVLHPDWVFRTLQVRSHEGRKIHLHRSADGSWHLDGASRPDLVEAVDIDLAFSPFTNTLPIRRLRLAVGDAAEITTAYVDAPSLQVLPDPQRYTRVAVDRYLYESLDSDFTREITVDPDGFVVDYPGLFRREGTTGWLQAHRRSADPCR